MDKKGMKIQLYSGIFSEYPPLRARISLTKRSVFLEGELLRKSGSFMEWLQRFHDGKMRRISINALFRHTGESRYPASSMISVITGPQVY
jgi:hypothetical protein